MHVANLLPGLAADLRYAARQFRLNPGFAAVAILSLALGIGANTAIFQLINAISMRSLPVREPWRLSAVDTVPDFFAAGWMSGRTTALTYAQYQKILERQQAFDGVLAFNATRFNLSVSGQARHAEGLFVSSNFFDLLGVTPVLGRGLAPQPDDRPCSEPGVVLNYAFWRSEFGGDPSVVGRTLPLDGRRFRIAGVTPPEFFGLEPARRFDVAVPLCADALFDEKGIGRIPNKSAWFISLVGRLRPGWTVEQASRHMQALSPGVFAATVPEDFPPDAEKQYRKNRLKAVSAAAGISDLRRQYATPLWLLLSLTALVLLIACANLANLLLARATVREREMAVRQAVGASRGRLIRQLMVESLLLAAAGAALGASLAQSASQILIAFLSTSGQRLLLDSAFDWHVFAFVSGVALITCLIFGMTPAFHATRASPAGAMRGARGSMVSEDKSSLRRGLVVAQIAVCVVLLVSAILFGRSLQKLVSSETGIQTQGIVLATVTPGGPDVGPQRRSAAFERILESSRTLPGVEGVSTVSISPFSGSGWNQMAITEGERRQLSWFNRVGPGYFRTMKTPLLAGREFSPQDRKGSPAVAIVNEEFARIFFSGANPVGRTFRIEGKPDEVFRIVGQVRNTKYSSLREKTRSIAYLARDQETEVPAGLTFAIRATGPPGPVLNGFRQLTTAQPEMLVEFRILDVQVQQSVQRERMMASLTGGFGVLAALLSMLGLYGVMSYTVERRRSEISIRMAIGAAWQEVTGMVLRETARLVMIGLALGAGLSLMTTRYAGSLLFGLQPNDPAALAAACALLACTAMLAAWMPARRAARLDPATALRQE